jgi:hypothetical protein
MVVAGGVAGVGSKLAQLLVKNGGHLNEVDPTEVVLNGLFSAGTGRLGVWAQPEDRLGEGFGDLFTDFTSGTESGTCGMIGSFDRRWGGC